MNAFFVELVLYNGSRMQSELLDERGHAMATRRSFLDRSMVEDAYVIDCRTGEVLGFTRSLAARHRGDEPELIEADEHQEPAGG